MPPSLDNQADALNTKPPAQTDARFAFSHRHLVFVSDVGLAGWGVALNLSRHERTDADGRHIPRMRASSSSSSSSQFSNLSSTPMTPDRRRARRRAAASVCPGPVAVGPPFHYAKSSMRRPPPSLFGQPRDRVDGRGSHDGCGHLSLRSAGGRRTDIFFPTCACVSGEHVGDRCARLLT